jgi:cytochrome c biogenesis protein CcmG/thiol:disulfide interchange protein DsbE
MKSLLRTVLLVVAALVVFQLFAQRSTPPLAGTAPPLSLPDLEGRQVDLSHYRGQVVAVNFWATWCGPCRAELPALAAFRNAQQGKCFEVLGVAEESGRRDLWAMAPAIPYPILVDERASARDGWGVQAYPKTFVVDTEGRVAKVFSGAVSHAELEGVVTPLLPRTCPAS